MQYGELELICGPMFSGKSAELLKRVLWERSIARKKTLLLKPAFDTRFGPSSVVTRAGTSAEAVAIETWPDVDADIKLVFIDEVQFLEEPHFHGDAVSGVRDLLSRGIDVVASGLDIDVYGHPFSVTSALAAMADIVHKKTADCTVCGRAATKTFKKCSDGPVVQLGDRELYEARCNTHWKSCGQKTTA